MKKSVFKSYPDKFDDLLNDTVKRAAESGNIRAQLELARRYEDSRRLADPGQAAYWHKRALSGLLKIAESGDLEMRLSLGRLYRFGVTNVMINKDTSAFNMWYQDAVDDWLDTVPLELAWSVDKGDLGMGFSLGLVNFLVVGNARAEENEDESNYWHRSAFEGCLKSAEKGDAKAQCLLGECFDQGLGTDEDRGQALYWFEKAADRGNTGAMFELRALYADKTRDDCDKDKSEYWKNKYRKTGFLKLKKSAEKGDAGDQNRLGNCYALGIGTKPDLDEAERLYRLALSGIQKAAVQGDARALMHLGIWHFCGKGVPQDKRAAVMLYKRAAEKGNTDAMKTVGDCYKAGAGVGQSDEESLRWYEKAANQGNYRAAHELRDYELRQWRLRSRQSSEHK